MRAAIGLAAMLVAGSAAIGSAATAAPAQGDILAAGGPTAVSGSYIVVFKDGASLDTQIGTLTSKYSASVGHTYRHTVSGAELRVSEAAARQIAALPNVKYVQQNHTVTIQGTQTPTPSWGLDRVDQRALPLDNSFTYPNTATGVRAYIIDTGIRITHVDFGGRAVWGTNTTGDGNNTDCHGHGTHVAGTTAGSTYGLAKGASLTAVKVLDCAGSGTNAGVIAGIDWVTNDHAAGAPAVANMSLGGGFDQATNDAVTASIADGVTYAIAAGNDNGANACNVSPASTPNAITVGATTNTDARSSFSNIGTCLDIFAPGSSITSDWGLGSDTATNTISGTSMATPHVAGAAALVLGTNPSWTPLQVRDFLVNNATNGVVTGAGTGSPNKLLFVVNAAPSQDFSIAVSPASGAVNPGGSISATVSTATTAGAAQTVALSASGAPAGVSVAFSPSSVTSGGSSTMTVSTTGAAAAGTYPIVILGDGTAVDHSVTFTLTVNGAPGCSGTNGNDVAIPDLSTVESNITISGCAGNAGSASTVEVHILHTYIGDLVVNLVAPDGSLYLLHNRAGGSADNINTTYTVNLSSEASNGTWKLRVQDAAAADVGTIDSWTLNLGGTAPPGCSGTNGTDVAIPDLSTVNSAIAISGCTGNASSTSTVEVHIIHTYIGDLIVTLVAPDGSTYVLHNRAGGSADNINQTYTVNLSSEARNGTWTLRVQDAAAADVGTIDSWTLTL